MNHLIIQFQKENIQKYIIKQGAQLNQTNQNKEFIFGEDNIYHQIGNRFLKFDNTVRKNETTNFHYDDPKFLVNNAFAIYFKETRLTTTIGSDIEHNKVIGTVFAIMKVTSNQDGDLLSQFDTINENDIQILERIANLPPIYIHKSKNLNFQHNKCLRF